jgi:hypothetical protein
MTANPRLLRMASSLRPALRRTVMFQKGDIKEPLLSNQTIGQKEGDT